MRYTLATLKASRIPQAINISGTDSRFVQIANEAVERLITRGHFLGTAGRYVLSVSDSQIVTLPASLASIERVSVNSDPIPIRSGFWEFLGSGEGVRSDTTNYAEALRIPGLYPTAIDVTPGHSLRLICDSATDVGKAIIITGLDEDGNEVRTSQSGSILPGESISLATTPGTDSTFDWSQITGIIAPSNLNYGWWLYDLDGATATLIGSYAHYDTHPGWTRYRIGSVSDGTETVEAIGRSAYVPMKNDNDWCLISNLSAMKYAMHSVILDEANMPEKAEIMLNKAIRELDFQLRHYSEAEQPAIEVVGPLLGGADDPVEQLY